MIKAVFFDMYNTLSRFEPRREGLQKRVCSEFGIEVTESGIIRGYLVADDFMALENGRHHLAKRSKEERREFFAEYEQMILRGAGVEAPLALAGEIFQAIRRIPYQLALFDDAIPCLKALKERGMILGLITNIYSDMRDTCDRLGITEYLDFIVTSGEVQSEKPHPPIFRYALRKAGVQPSEVVHVGDQYNSDVVGARGVGIKPVLIDRESLMCRVGDCIKVRGLMELLEHI